MKRIALAAIALSMIAAPMAQAQPRHDAPRWQQQQQHYHGQKHHGPGQFKKQRWSRGERVPEWQRKQYVRDYRRHGLKRPGRHQQWVKVNNDYLLIGLASGVIAAIVSGR